MSDEIASLVLDEHSADCEGGKEISFLLSVSNSGEDGVDGLPSSTLGSSIKHL